MPILDKNNKEQVGKYLDFIRNSKYRTLTQDLNWSNVKWDWENEQVYTENNGEITAAISILIKRVPLAGALLYAPRGPVCDINDTSAVEDLLKEVEPLIKKYNAFALKMDPEVLFSEELEKKLEQNGFADRKSVV